MKRSILIMSFLFSLLLVLQGCQDGAQNNEVENLEEEVETETTTQTSSKELENTDVVSSGTYTGTAIVVDDQQKEVYVQIGDTTKIELYFNNETEVVRNGEPVAFEELEEGQRVRVTVQKEGQSLKPERVEILEQ